MSWGGVVAQELYRRRPELVAGLILADSYAGWAGSLPAESAPSASPRAWRQSELPPQEVAAAWMPSLFSERAPGGGRRRARRDHPRLPSCGLPPRCPRGRRRRPPRPAAADRGPDPAPLGRARRPLAGRDRASGCATRSAGARLAVIPECGHVSNLERPERFNDEAARLLPRARLLSSRPVLPNILLVVLDTARADALEPYGAPPGANAGDRRPRPPRPRASRASTPPPAGPCPRTRRCSPGCSRARPGSSTCPRARRSPAARRSPRTATASSPTCCAAHGYETRAPSAPTSGSRSTRASASASTSSATSAPGARPTSTEPGSATALRWAREALRAKADDGAAAAGGDAAGAGSTRRAASRGSGS